MRRASIRLLIVLIIMYNMTFLKVNNNSNTLFDRLFFDFNKLLNVVVKCDIASNLNSENDDCDHHDTRNPNFNALLLAYIHLKQFEWKGKDFKFRGDSRVIELKNGKST